jgi:hypothetical protein
MFSYQQLVSRTPAGRAVMLQFLTTQRLYQCDTNMVAFELLIHGSCEHPECFPYQQLVSRTPAGRAVMLQFSPYTQRLIMYKHGCL